MFYCISYSQNRYFKTSILTLTVEILLLLHFHEHASWVAASNKIKYNINDLILMEFNYKIKLEIV